MAMQFLDIRDPHKILESRPFRSKWNKLSRYRIFNYRNRYPNLR